MAVPSTTASRFSVRQLLSYGLAEGAARTLNWLTLVVLSLILAPNAYGIVALAVAIETLGTSVLLVGQDRAVLRFYHADAQPGRLLSGVLTIGIASAGLAIGFLAFGARGRESLFGMPVFPHLAALSTAIVLLFIYTIYLAILRAEDAVADYALFRLGFQVSKFIAVLGLAFSLRNSAAYVVGLLSAASIVVIAASPGLRARLTWSIDLRRITALWTFGWPLVFHALSGGTLMYIDRFMLLYYLNAASVGIYSLGYTIGASVAVVFGTLAVYFEPHIYRHSRNTGQSEHWLAMFALFAIGGAAAVGAVLWMLLPLAFEHLFSPGYAPAISVVPVILAAHLLIPIYLQANYRLTILQRTSLIAVSTAIAALSNVIANALLIPYLGIRGAAIATFASYCVLAVVSTAASLIIPGRSFRQPPSLPAALTAFVCAAVILSAGYSSISFLALLSTVGIVVIFMHRTHRNGIVGPATG